MQSPIISVVVPVYRTENYIYRCLQSIKNQTFRNFEVLIINDCTPDNAVRIAEKFVEEDSRFRIIHHEQNKGAGAARNTGIDHAKGEYIAFLDSDDEYSLDALRALYNCAVLNEADMVIGRMFQHDEKRSRIFPVEYIELRVRSYLKSPNKNLREIASKNFYTGNINNNLYKLTLFKNNSIKFLENKVYHEDMPATLELWYFSRKIAVVPDIVHFRTIRNDASNLSITQTFNKKAFYDRDVIVDYIFDFCLKHANPKNDLLELTIEILARINGTTRTMLKQIKDADIIDEIINIWYPKFVEKVENIILYLKKLKNEWKCDVI